MLTPSLTSGKWLSFAIDSSKSSDGSSKKLSLSTFCISENKASSSSFGFTATTLPKLFSRL
uniref:Uncharacterized protein n=1 Tax=Arundo donax TaxID=35708 RepID=A0A0A9CYK0_ARUDO